MEIGNTWRDASGGDELGGKQRFPHENPQFSALFAVNYCRQFIFRTFTDRVCVRFALSKISGLFQLQRAFGDSLAEPIFRVSFG